MEPLISAADLARRLDDVRVLDARPSAEAYAKEHLAGAIHARLDADLSATQLPGHDPAHGGRHPLPPPSLFAEKLRAWGIGPSTPVVVYDDQGGANSAARAWWMLRALGHDEVAVLDGGLASARAAGIPLTAELSHPAPATGPASATRWERPIVSMDEVAARAASSEWRVLDVRSTERFRGEVETLDPVAGHIPGAVNLYLGENLAPDGRFKSREELRAIYERLLGGLSPERLVVHCGSGVTACHTLLALDVAGLGGAALYVGSWSEWCRSGRPQAKGA
jgi:thiosulfate/3-mercaptopyruvate sulfurtransferase